MTDPFSLVVYDRQSTTLSRRRWLSAVGASFVATTLGCDAGGKSSSGSPSTGSATSDPLAFGPPFVDGPLRSSFEWLWSQQANKPSDGQFFVPTPDSKLPQSQDGSWRSAKYAQLRSGQALTPLVLAVLQKSYSAYTKCPIWVMLSEDFVRKSVDDDGVVGMHDPELPEYPNYATSLALQCVIGGRRDDDGPLIERMTTYLVGQQYCEANGYVPDHVCYGGWGFGGARPVGDSPGHMDIGHTRHVLQALRAAGHDEPATYARAEKFLRLMQKHPTEDRRQPSSARVDRPTNWRPPYDGGFYFSPIVHAANKGGELQHEGHPYFANYATATCDGILALLACRVPRDDERIASAINWLKKHPRLDYPEGVQDGTDTNWGASIRFYHFAVRAECYAAIDWPGAWRRELRVILTKLQQPDGSFVNREGFLIKEDDPILCTALAVSALAACEELEQ